jgi:hypothetical protein
MVRRRLRKQRLASAGRAGQQNPLERSDAHLLDLLTVGDKIDRLQQLLLGCRLPADIFKLNARHRAAGDGGDLLAAHVPQLCRLRQHNHQAGHKEEGHHVVALHAQVDHRADNQADGRFDHREALHRPIPPSVRSFSACCPTLRSETL